MTSQQAQVRPTRASSELVDAVHQHLQRQKEDERRRVRLQKRRRLARTWARSLFVATALAMASLAVLVVPFYSERAVELAVGTLAAITAVGFAFEVMTFQAVRERRQTVSA